MAGVVLAVVLIALSSCAWSAGHAKAPASTEKHGSVSLNSGGGEMDFLASLNGETPKEETKDPPIYVTALSFIFKLAVVLALAYATILGLKKFSGMKGTIGAGSHRIRVIENSALGANRSLHLVQVGQKRLLVASTPAQINLLTEVDAEDIPQAEPTEPTGTGSGFKEHLAKFLGAKPNTDAAAKSVAEMLRDSSSLLQDKVREVGRLRGKFRNA